MKSSMEVSLYPLGTNDLGTSISRFISILEEHGCHVETGSMSTLVTADSSVLFDAMKQAYEHVSSKGGVVVVMKISNTCPV
ncbi:MAG: YkoF family thiamine/hydroxymethylpyrimidine-binding protein [Spirochaetota bacterium]